MRDVKGKTAFITGGASGIGLGMARAFARAGMNVAIADIRNDHLKSALELFARQGHAKQVCAIKLDVTNRKRFAEAAHEAEAAFGRIHVLCNNAGIDVGGRLEETRFDDWDWGLGVMLGGAVNGLLTIVPRMRAHGEGGHIVNTASMAALVPVTGFSIYTAAKMALIGIALSLREELAPHKIGVSAFCPGPVKSNIHESARTRPAKYKHDSGLAERHTQLARRIVSDAWMDPLECGERVLRGIRRNDLYILTHPEFKAGAAEHFEVILDSFPDEPINQGRADAIRYILTNPMFAKIKKQTPSARANTRVPKKRARRPPR
jgi:NAD(P)-dependent dehydrogenase (short-subunit alcohol dehydrogenase family)